MIPIRAFALTLLCALMSAGLAIAGKLLVTTIPSMSITFLRISIATLCFLPFVRPRTFIKITRSDMSILLLAGSIGIFLSNIFYFAGMQSTTALHASLINSLTPPLMLVATAILSRQMPSRMHFLSFGLALMGVFLIITEGNFSASALLNNTGNLLMFASVICWVLYSLTIEQKSSQFPSAAFTFGTLLIGTLLLAPLSMREGITQTVYSLTSLQWGLILYISVIGTGVGYYVYGKCIEQIGPDISAFIIFSTAPIFVVFLSLLLLNDPVTSWELAGSACIVASLYFTLKTKKY